MTDLQIIIPRSPSAYEIRIKSHYEIWKLEKEAKEERFVIENVHFPHDPHWREGWFSLSCIADCNAGKCPAIGPTIFWGAIRVAWLLGAAGPYFIKMF